MNYFYFYVYVYFYFINLHCEFNKCLFKEDCFVYKVLQISHLYFCGWRSFKSEKHILISSGFFLQSADNS